MVYHQPVVDTRVAGDSALVTNFALSADGNVVSAVAGKSVIVLALWLSPNHSAQDGAVTLKSGSAGGVAAIQTHQSTLGALVLPFNPGGWGATVPGQSLFMDIDGGTSPEYVGNVTYYYLEV